MSNVLRSASKHARSLSQAIRPLSPAPTRSYYSPFAVLGNSPLTSPPPPTSRVSSAYHVQGELYEDTYPPHSGNKTYVVCPIPSNSFYAVPSGAYPTSAPYVNYTATEAPDTDGASLSSTSANQFAHPLTRAAPQHPDGVGESAAIRNSEAPGLMGARGGSYGGLGLMDKEGTKAGEGQLASRNPPPDSKVAKQFSQLGVDEAWKARK